MRKIITVLVLMSVMAGLLTLPLARPSQAQEIGIAVGAKAPDLSGALDQAGKPRDLASLMGGKGVALLFFRSASW